MAFWDVLTEVLILLAGALVLGAVFERLRQSAILGYLLAGMLLGPADRLSGVRARILLMRSPSWVYHCFCL